MCIIGICEKRALTEKEFNSCWNSNRHGMGFAYWNGEEVYMKKGFMDKAQAWKVYQTVPVPHIVHFRIASAGEVCKELTHPFICSPKSGLVLEHQGKSPVLFHNGTVCEWRNLLMNAVFATKVVPKGVMSDSRAMAIAVSVLGADILTMYATHKWVVVHREGFIKVGEWLEAEGGVLFSNSGFRSYTPTCSTEDYSTWGWGWRKSSEEEKIPQQKEFIESFNAVAIRNNGRSCVKCKHYDCTVDGEHEFCERLNKRLDDYKPCKHYDETIRRTCSNCCYFVGEKICGIRGDLKDNVACNQWEKLEEQVEEMIDPCASGLRGKVVDGKFVPKKESDYMKKLRQRYQGGVGTTKTDSVRLFKK